MVSSARIFSIGEKYELEVMALSRHMLSPSDCDMICGMNSAGQSFFQLYILTLVRGHFQYRRVIISNYNRPRHGRRYILSL
jgi:hypothetical protein